jgi:hypothetical protein
MRWLTMKMENRMTLDYAMLLALLALILKPLTGVFAHEALGAGFLLLVALHVCNNRRWATKAFSKKGGTFKSIGMLAVNAMLSASILLTMFSGIMVSVELFGFLDIPYREIFYRIHSASGQAVLALAIMHLLLHMKMIKAFFAKMKQERRK